MAGVGRYLPQHADEVDALFSIYPDRITALSYANDPDDTDTAAEIGDVAAASSNAEYAVLKVSVPLSFPECDRDCVVIEAWLDADSATETSLDSGCGEQKDAHAIAGAAECRPTFERTESGRRLYCQFSVINSLPMDLVVILLPGYPEFKPPDFVLFSSCLSNSQKMAICKKLDELSAENEGLPTILTWLDWLQNDCMKFLGVTKIVLSSSQEPLDELDCRIGDTELIVLERIESLIRHDMQTEQKLFETSDHECPVCFDSLPGTGFYRLDLCRHYCCRACLLAYIQQSMQDGKVQYLKCPEEKCETVLPVPIIRALLSDEEWRRWETLALNRALDTMGDLDWCPRCKMPVVQDEDHRESLLAQCAYCYFAFCTQCRDSWHQVNKCASLEEKLEKLENETGIGSKSDYEIKRAIFLKKQDILSSMKVRQMSKPCPSCGAPIEKESGCNKVSCTNCYCTMCYRCGEEIAGYDHFNTAGVNCPLHDDQLGDAMRRLAHPRQAALEVEAMLALGINMQHRNVRCPACHHWNLKVNRNNHIFCHACNTYFCYLCRKRIVGGTKTHFGVTANRCPQHSDD